MLTTFALSPASAEETASTSATTAAPPETSRSETAPPATTAMDEPTADEEVPESNPETKVFKAPASSRTQSSALLAEQPEMCPVGPDMTAYTAPPRLVGAWFNTKDIEERGVWNPTDHRPWKFSQRFGQLLCNTAPGATIKIGMYFLRATNASNAQEIGRPESDPGVLYEALEWLAVTRQVKISVILDNTNTCATAAEGQSCSHIMTPTARAAVEKRFATIPGSTIMYCVNGCFNTARYGVYPYAIEHEKFFAVSDTNYPGETAGAHPLVISSSVNIARSQIRNYHQEASWLYDDKQAFTEFDRRFDGMESCAIDHCKLLGDPDDHTIPAGSSAGDPPVPPVPNALGLVQEEDRFIWVDPILRRPTDLGRGTRITFSPQRNIAKSDVFINQFDGVDCAVDNQIRLAMFKLTDAKAQDMANTLKSLKSRGCDIKMLMTSQGGQTIISPGVRKTLDSIGLDYKCTVDAMHTKMILIGPKSSNYGRVLHGTANMSVAGQLYSEEHVITYDARAASGAGREALRDVYGDYQTEWYELSRGASKKYCG